MICKNFLSLIPNTEHPKVTITNCLKTDMFILPSASLIPQGGL